MHIIYLLHTCNRSHVIGTSVFIDHKLAIAWRDYYRSQGFAAYVSTDMVETSQPPQPTGAKHESHTPALHG